MQYPSPESWARFDTQILPESRGIWTKCELGLVRAVLVPTPVSFDRHSRGKPAEERKETSSRAPFLIFTSIGT